jgi:glycosyltransferase involved in cell wall biosynthesis
VSLAVIAAASDGRSSEEHTSAQQLGRRLRVLVLDEEPPLPLNSGKRIRTWNLLSRLGKRHSITFLTYGIAGSDAAAEFARQGIDVRLVPPPPSHSGMALYLRLLANCFSTRPYSVAKHDTAAYRRIVTELCRAGEFDVVHCEWTPYAAHLDRAAGIPSVVATHNIEAQIWRRRAEQSANPLAQIFFADQARKMERFERDVFARCAWVSGVSEADAECARRWNARQASVIDNGVDLEKFAAGKAPRSSDLLFLGSLDWFPNTQGLEWFANQVWPRIREQRPQAKLRIVGRRPSQQLAALAARVPGFELVGEVPDPVPYLQQAALTIVPLHIGGGSRIKILEALACATPVISTSVGAEGLAVRNGEHLRIADSPAEFARAVIESLARPAEADALAVAGRRLVEERYSWDGIATALEAVWQRVSSSAGVAR